MAKGVGAETTENLLMIYHHSSRCWGEKEILRRSRVRDLCEKAYLPQMQQVGL